jgi:predicted ATP-grasp superfamily ATP-dependent carboligase
MSCELPEVASRSREASPAIPANGTARPPVFVMNPYYTGLGIARALAGTGVRVVALTSEPDAPGVRSRYFDTVERVPNGRDDPAGLCAALERLAAKEPGKPVLFPTRDFDIVFLAQHHDVLAPLYELPQPARSPILRMMDKLELAQVATRLGIATPLTLACETGEEVERAAASLAFPVIVKPRLAYQWRKAGMWERIGAQKAFIVESADALRALYARLAAHASDVLVQEYVPGDDADIVVCCCYMDGAGELAGHFTGRKLRQNPPLVGTGSVIEATPVPEVVAPSVELLRAFGYRGVAEIEFKRDRARGRYSLIEINPRHWDQHELGCLVGVNISWLAYADRVGAGAAPCQPRYADGERYKWIAESELAHSTLRNLWHAVRGGAGRLARVRRTLAETAELMSGHRIYATARLADPLPGILTALRTTGGLLRAALRGRT